MPSSLYVGSLRHSALRGHPSAIATAPRVIDHRSEATHEIGVIAAVESEDHRGGEADLIPEVAS
jgi:hypothetical protein